MKAFLLKVGSMLIAVLSVAGLAYVGIQVDKVYTNKLVGSDAFEQRVAKLESQVSEQGIYVRTLTASVQQLVNLMQDQNTNLRQTMGLCSNMLDIVELKSQEVTP